MAGETMQHNATVHQSMRHFEFSSEVISMVMTGSTDGSTLHGAHDAMLRRTPDTEAEFYSRTSHPRPQIKCDTSKIVDRAKKTAWGAGKNGPGNVPDKLYR